jgi:hypothetical protein
VAHSGGSLSHRFLVRYQTIADVRWVIKNFSGGGNNVGTPESVCAATQRLARRTPRCPQFGAHAAPFGPAILVTQDPTGHRRVRVMDVTEYWIGVPRQSALMLAGRVDKPRAGCRFGYGGGAFEQGHWSEAQPLGRSREGSPAQQLGKLGVKNRTALVVLALRGLPA